MWRMVLVILVATAVWAQSLTDAEVLAALNADRPADQRVSDKSVRILRPDLPGVVLVGYLTGGRGALLGTVFVDGKKWGPGDASRLVLGRLGWEAAGPAERQQLARVWLEKAQLAFAESIVEDGGADFKRRDAPRFEKPRFESTAAGGVRVAVWIKEDSGNMLSTNYRKGTYYFDADGKLSRAKVMDNFYVPSR